MLVERLPGRCSVPRATLHVTAYSADKPCPVLACLETLLLLGEGSGLHLGSSLTGRFHFPQGRCVRSRRNSACSAPALFLPTLCSGGANVTLGIPRLREIIQTASRTALLQSRHGKIASSLRRLIRRRSHHPYNIILKFAAEAGFDECPLAPTHSQRNEAPQQAS